MDLFKKSKYGFRVLIICLIFLFGKNGTAQTSIAGKVINEETKVELVNAGIILYKNENRIRTARTDENGDYKFNVDPGTYAIEFSKRGYPTERLIQVIVMEGQTTKVNYQLLHDRHMCGLITQMRIQLARIEKMEKGQTFVESTFKGNPNREIKETIMMTPGVSFSQ